MLSNSNSDIELVAISFRNITNGVVFECTSIRNNGDQYSLWKVQIYIQAYIHNTGPGSVANTDAIMIDSLSANYAGPTGILLNTYTLT
jgi:hypothetical protein